MHAALLTGRGITSFIGRPTVANEIGNMTLEHQCEKFKQQRKGAIHAFREQEDTLCDQHPLFCAQHLQLQGIDNSLL